MPLNIWVCNEFCSTYIFTIAYIFFKSSSLPFFETINPRITIENTIRTHFLGLNWLCIPSTSKSIIWAFASKSPYHYVPFSCKGHLVAK